MVRFRRVGLMLVCALAILSFSISAQDAHPKKGGTLVAFVSSDPKSLDPALISSWDQAFMSVNLLEGLTRHIADGTEVKLALADSYKVSEDGKTWTFHIRKNAKFHNGRPITSQDFKYTFERVLDPKTRSPKAWMLDKVVGAPEFRSGKTQEVSGITCPDSETLVIRLQEPLAPFFSMLACPNLAVVDRKEVEKWGDGFGQHVVSAGPFALSGWKPNQELTLAAFDGYWAGRPYLDGVRYRFIPDENTRMLEFMAKTLDVAWLTPAYHDKVTHDPVLGKHIGRGETLHTEFLAVNLKKSPFGTNKTLRKAMQAALDVGAVLDMLQHRASLGTTLLPPKLAKFPVPEQGAHDLAKAKELMKKAGFENGVPGTFAVIGPPWGNLTKILEIYQANLKEIGINIEIRLMQFPAYIEALESGDYALAWAYRVADYADPDAFYFPLLYSANAGAAGNVAGYSNPTMDSLLVQARTTMDAEKRVTLYKRIEGLFAEDLPYIPLMHNIWVDVSQPYVMNYVPSVMDFQDFSRVWLSK
ncbi:MAG: ABC transporter substrate-binding protein [Bacteroidota bacterium]